MYFVVSLINIRGDLWNELEWMVFLRVISAPLLSNTPVCLCISFWLYWLRFTTSSHLQTLCSWETWKVKLNSWLLLFIYCTYTYAVNWQILAKCKSTCRCNMNRYYERSLSEFLAHLNENVTIILGSTYIKHDSVLLPCFICYTPP